MVPQAMVYVIQIGALHELRGAKNLAESARKKGLAAYTVRDNIGDRQGYRVLLGGFVTLEEALRYMRSARVKKIFGESFVRKIPATHAYRKEDSGSPPFKK
jgi:cell division septation protein DedD